MNLPKYKIISKTKKDLFEYYVLIDELDRKLFLKKTISKDIDLVKSQKNEIQKYQYIVANDKTINIPNIISYENNYIIYEYIEGIKLTELKGVSLRNLLIIYYKICEQVKKIHKLNLVHGDLKLINILLKGNDIYIIDYGACSFVGERIYFGSKIYCSIDQLTKKPSTFKFDIYALGVILYRFVEKKPPYIEFADTKDLINQKEQGFPILKNIHINYINDINNLIQKMVSGNINLDEVIEEIKRIIIYIGVD